MLVTSIVIYSVFPPAIYVKRTDTGLTAPHLSRYFESLSSHSFLPSGSGHTHHSGPSISVCIWRQKIWIFALLTLLFHWLFIASHQVSAVQRDQLLEKKSRKKEWTHTQDQGSIAAELTNVRLMCCGCLVVKRASPISCVQHSRVPTWPAGKGVMARTTAKAEQDSCPPPRAPKRSRSSVFAPVDPCPPSALEQREQEARPGAEPGWRTTESVWTHPPHPQPEPSLFCSHNQESPVRRHPEKDSLHLTTTLSSPQKTFHFHSRVNEAQFLNLCMTYEGLD